jgi:hypothetical protein
MAIAIAVTLSIFAIHLPRKKNELTCASNMDTFGANCATCKNAIEHVSNLKEYLKIDYKSIITHDMLDNIEKSVPKNSQIYALTSDFTLENGDFKNIIIENMKRGVRYTYFIPNTEDDVFVFTNSVIESWKLLIPNLEELLTCYAIRADLTYMTILAYSVEAKEKTEIIVKFPTGKYYNATDFPFHFKIPVEAIRERDKMRNMLLGLKKNKETIRIWGKND